MPSDVIVSGLYKSKIQDSVQLQTVLALYDQETARNNEQTSEFGTKLWKEDPQPRVKEERKPTLRGKWESVFSGRHMDNVPKETHAASVMTK